RYIFISRDDCSVSCRSVVVSFALCPSNLHGILVVYYWYKCERITRTTTETSTENTFTALFFLLIRCTVNICEYWSRCISYWRMATLASRRGYWYFSATHCRYFYYCDGPLCCRLVANSVFNERKTNAAYKIESTLSGYFFCRKRVCGRLDSLYWHDYWIYFIFRCKRTRKWD